MCLGRSNVQKIFSYLRSQIFSPFILFQCTLSFSAYYLLK